MAATLGFLFAAGLLAGAMNALAGGGSFITLAALVLTGLDPRVANITSTIALFPGQLTNGLSSRSMVEGVGRIGFWGLVVISLGGGVVGAFLLLATPSSVFAALVPYLVLFATAVFFWGSFLRKHEAIVRPIPSRVVGLVQLAIAIYGGYFGGGIGFLMLAALTMAGLSIRPAGATKNALAAAMNASAVVVFLFAPGVAWLQAGTLCIAAIAGGLGGSWMLKRVPEMLLRGFVVVVGLALTVLMFLRA